MANSSKRKTKKRSYRTSGNPARKPVVEAAPVTYRNWIAAARLRTLPLAVAPVVAGTGAAQLVDRELHWVIALACLAVAVSLQIGVNFANDYSDGIRGTDDYRVGPARLTGSRRVKPKHVAVVALVFFGLGALAGLAIIIRTEQWWMLAVGAVCLLAAWFYTGGKRPYGYYAMGEIAVFIFFGLVATLGTTWVQAFQLREEAWFAAIAMGLFATAVLLTNNLRDIAQDRTAGKRTLSTFIGRRATQVMFTVLVLVPFLGSSWIALLYPIAWMALLALLAVLPAILIVWTYGDPKELVIALSLISLASLGYAGALYWAFVG